jgi:hypothetical protein
VPKLLLASLAVLFAISVAKAESEQIQFSCFAHSDFTIDGNKLFRNGKIELRVTELSITPQSISWTVPLVTLDMIDEYELDRRSGTLRVDEYFRVTRRDIGGLNPFPMHRGRRCHLRQE